MRANARIWCCALTCVCLHNDFILFIYLMMADGLLVLICAGSSFFFSIEELRGITGGPTEVIVIN